MFACCIALVSLLCLATTAGAESERLALDEIFPTGVVEIDFLDVRPTDAVAAVVDKISGQVDREWLLQYVADAKPGEPLAYHPKMGLSQKEYQAMLNGLAGMSLVPVGVQIELKISKEHGIYTFEPIGKKSETLRSLRIDSSAMTASMGDISMGPGVWAESRQPSVVGPWRGYKWAYEEGNPLAIAFGGDFQIKKARFIHLIGTDWILVDLESNQRISGKAKAFRTMFRYEVKGIGQSGTQSE